MGNRHLSDLKYKFADLWCLEYPLDLSGHHEQELFVNDGRLQSEGQLNNILLIFGLIDANTVLELVLEFALHSFAVSAGHCSRLRRESIKSHDFKHFDEDGFHVFVASCDRLVLLGTSVLQERVKGLGLALRPLLVLTVQES